MVKFLIIRFSSIGDIVLTTPVIRCLRKKFPDAEIHYLTKKSFRTIIDNNPYVDVVQILEDDLQQVITTLQQEKYDYIIDLHHNLRTLRIKKALGKIKSFSFNKLNIRKWMLTALKINLMPEKHIVDRYLETVETLGVLNDGLGLDYFIPKNEEISNEDLPIAHTLGYIAIVIGAAHTTKKLPIHKLQALCKGINYPLILVGGPEDREAGDQVASIDPIRIYNACGKFKLNESADLVRKAKLVISHDTGLMHIAAAFNKRILSVWGNTVPSFGMYPYKTEHEIFEVKKLWCRPCSKIGYNTCPLGHFKCMEKISVEAIIAKSTF